MAWVRCVAVIAIGVLVITSPARAGGLSLDKTGTAASASYRPGDDHPTGEKHGYRSITDKHRLGDF